MTSQNGEKLIKVGDFTFTKEDICDEDASTRWSCYTHQSCEAKVFTDYDKVIYVQNIHNHSPTEFFV